MIVVMIDSFDGMYEPYFFICLAALRQLSREAI